jgi:hypothetical protein
MFRTGSDAVLATFCLLEWTRPENIPQRRNPYQKPKKSVDGGPGLDIFLIKEKEDLQALSPGKDTTRAMFHQRILVIHPSPSEAERLARLAKKYGPALVEIDAEAALAAFAEGDVAVAVVDAAFSRSTALRAMVRPPTGVLLTGDDEDEVSRAADEWPPGIDVDFCRTSPAEPRETAFLRALGRIAESVRLKAEAAKLRRSLGLQETKVKDVRASSARSRSGWPSRPATWARRRSASGSSRSCGGSTAPTTSTASSTSSPRSGTSSRPRASPSISWRRTRSSAATSSRSSGTTPS